MGSIFKLREGLLQRAAGEGEHVHWAAENKPGCQSRVEGWRRVKQCFQPGAELYSRGAGKLLEDLNQVSGMARCVLGRVCLEAV